MAHTLQKLQVTEKGTQIQAKRNSNLRSRGARIIWARSIPSLQVDHDYNQGHEMKGYHALFLKMKNIGSYLAFLGLPTGLFTGTSPSPGSCSVSTSLLCSSKSISDLTTASLFFRRWPFLGDLVGVGVVFCKLGCLLLRFLEPVCSCMPIGRLK